MSERHNNGDRGAGNTARHARQNLSAGADTEAYDDDHSGADHAPHDHAPHDHGPHNHDHHAVGHDPADHNHPHTAPPNPNLEPRRSASESAALAQRVATIEALLIEKGLVSRETLDALVDVYENDIGPMSGARVVARAWVDADYKGRLLDDATAAIAELGFGGIQGEHMVVVENTPAVHNVVVCTLCSCYPWPVLGLPPTWYKSAPYRSRVVIDPRGVLRELGLELDDAIEVRVWDSSAEVRYLVLPERPAGTEHLGEDELAELVSRDAMIGVAKVEYPAP